MIKLMRYNKNFVSLDLTNNELKDEFVSVTLNMLKNNPHILEIKVLGNPISLKRIKAINDALERNNKLAKNDKAPNYNREITRLKVIVSNTGKVAKTFKQVVKECKEEQKVVESRKRLLDDVKETEMEKTKQLEDEIEEGKRKYAEIVMECNQMDDKYRNTNEGNVYKTNDMRESIKSMNVAMENIYLRSNYYSNYSETNQGRFYSRWKKSQAQKSRTSKKASIRTIKIVLQVLIHSNMMARTYGRNQDEFERLKTLYAPRRKRRTKRKESPE